MCYKLTLLTNVTGGVKTAIKGVIATIFFLYLLYETCIHTRAAGSYQPA